MKGLLLDKDGDIRIVPHKGKDGLTGFVIGDTLIQNAAIVLELNQGELKEDPVLGANLIRYIRSQADKRAIESFPSVLGGMVLGTVSAWLAGKWKESKDDVPDMADIRATVRGALLADVVILLVWIVFRLIL